MHFSFNPQSKPLRFGGDFLKKSQLVHEPASALHEGEMH
jgi:hypothetical protein